MRERHQGINVSMYQCLRRLACQRTHKGALAISARTHRRTLTTSTPVDILIISNYILIILVSQKIKLKLRCRARISSHLLRQKLNLIGNVATLQTSHQIYLIDKISNVNTNLIITINISGVIVKIIPYVITIELLDN